MNPTIRSIMQAIDTLTVMRNSEPFVGMDVTTPLDEAINHLTEYAKDLMFDEAQDAFYREPR